MDNNNESSDYESAYESSDTKYDSDSSVSQGFSSGESDTDFDDLSYDIANNPVAQAPDLVKLTQTPWSQVTESENGHLDFQFEDSVSGTKHIENCDKPIDFFYLLYSPYLWNLIVENTNIYKECPHKEMKRCTCENHERFYGSCFQRGIS